MAAAAMPTTTTRPIVASVGRRAAKRRDRLCQIIVVDNGVGPERVHQRRAIDDLARSLDETQQCLERPGVQMNGIALRIFEHAQADVEPESIELETVLARRIRHPGRA